MSEPDQVVVVEKNYATFQELMQDLSESGIKAQEGVDKYQAHVKAALGPMPNNPFALAQFIEKVVGYLDRPKAAS